MKIGIIILLQALDFHPSIHACMHTYIILPVSLYIPKSFVAPRPENWTFIDSSFRSQGFETQDSREWTVLNGDYPPVINNVINSDE